MIKPRMLARVYHVVEKPEIESGSENGHSYESTVRSFTFDLNANP